MKKPYVVLIIITIILTVLTACGNVVKDNTTKENEKGSLMASTIKDDRPFVLNTERDNVLVYYSSENGKYLIPVTLPVKPTKEVAKVAVEKVLGGPGDWLLSSSIPEDTKLRDIYIRGNVAYIDLTNHFLKHESAEKAETSIKSLVLTLTEFAEVESVQFLIDGVVYEDIHGIEIDTPLNRPAVINSFNEIENEQVSIEVYYSDPNALYLVPVSYKVDENISFDQKVASIMTFLIEGPPLNSDLVKTIWTGTEINDITYNKDNKTLTLDLSKEIMGYGGGSTAEVILINSILYSMTALDEVDYVELLIDGEKVDHLPEGSDISTPLERPGHINYINL